jgi:hypothetical protein
MPVFPDFACMDVTAQASALLFMRKHWFPHPEQLAAVTGLPVQRVEQLLLSAVATLARWGWSSAALRREYHLTPAQVARARSALGEQARKGCQGNPARHAHGSQNRTSC